MKIKSSSGYSAATATKYINTNSPLLSLSSDLETKYTYENDKRTDQVAGYSAWFGQAGLDPFQIKFLEKIELPRQFAKVKIDNIEGCEVRNNVYFKASGITEAN